MAYKRKTYDVFELQIDYGYGHGWTCVTSELSRVEIRKRLREYAENEPGYSRRIVVKREKINQEQASET